MQVIADAVAAKRNHFMSSLQFGAGASAPGAVAWRGQRGHETVAGTDGVDDLDARRGDLHTFFVEHRERAEFAERHDTKFWAGLRPGGKSVLDWPSGIEPLEIFLACLNQMRERNLAFDEDCRRVVVWDYERTDIGIEADRPRRARARRRESGNDRLPVTQGRAAAIEPTCKWRAPLGHSVGNGHGPSKAVASR